MPVEIFTRKDVEKIVYEGKNKKEEKKDLMIGKLLNRRTTAKNLIGRIKGDYTIANATKNHDLAKYLEELIKFNNQLEKTKAQVRLKGWKGKSDINILRRPEYIEVLTYQKLDENSEPMEISTTISREEINGMIIAIGSLCKINEEVNARELIERYFRVMHINTNEKGQPLFNEEGLIWGNYFAEWRNEHNKLTILLRVLCFLKMITYKRGVTTLISDKFSIQEIFK